MITRRQMLKRGAAGGAALTVFRTVPGFAAPPTAFAQPLPIPEKAAKNAAGEYVFEMNNTSQQVLPPPNGKTDLWGYADKSGDPNAAFNGTPWSPGPTVDVPKDTAATVNYTMASGISELPGNNIAYDEKLDMRMPKRLRALTHLHGGDIAGGDDGNPFAVKTEFAPGQPYRVVYPNAQESGTLWYHEHSLGITRLNVYRGLAAFYFIRDPAREQGLPSGDSSLTFPDPLAGQGGRPANATRPVPYEIPLAIQDRNVNGTQLAYPAMNPLTTTEWSSGEWMPEFFGTVAIINGAFAPFVEVEPTVYRLRILNGSNSRFYNLQLGGGSTSFNLIGTDLSMVWRGKPVVLRKLLLSPAERADVLVDFTGLGGKKVVLTDTPLPRGTVSPATPLNTSDLMEFRVAKTPATKTFTVPKTISGPADPSAKGSPRPAADVVHTLEEVLDPLSGLPVMSLLDGKRFEEHGSQAPTATWEQVPAGTIVWDLVNLTADTHPIHVHKAHIEVVDRTPINVAGYQGVLDTYRNNKSAGGLWNPINSRTPGTPNYDPNPAWMDDPNPPLADGGPQYNIPPYNWVIGAPAKAPPEEGGHKDTVRANPGEVTRIRLTFSGPGDFVWHCHILEHEDNDMMRPLPVV